MNLLSVTARNNRADSRDGPAIVSALYAEHALGLTRLAQVMLGDRSAAEDVVHDAFFGLCRRWDHLTDSRKAPAYEQPLPVGPSGDNLRVSSVASGKAVS